MATAFEDSSEPEDVDPVKEAMSKGDRYLTFIFFERIYSVRRKCSQCGAPGTKCMPFEKRAPTLYLSDEGVVGTQEVQCLKCFNIEVCSSSEIFSDIPTDERLCMQGLEIHYYCQKVTHFELLHDLLELLHVAAIEDTKERKESHTEFTSFMLQKAKRVCEEWCKPEYTELRYKKFLVLHKETMVGPNYRPKVADDATDEYKEMYEMMSDSFYANRDKISILLALMKESLFDNPTRPFFFMWVGIAMMHTDHYLEFKQQYSVMIGDNPACTALRDKYMSLDIPVGIKKIPVIFVLFELPRFYHYVDFLTRRLGKVKPCNYLKDEEKKTFSFIEEEMKKSSERSLSLTIPSDGYTSERELMLRMATGENEFIPYIEPDEPTHSHNPRVISKDDFKEALIEHLKRSSDDRELQATKSEDFILPADAQRMLVKIESTGYNAEQEVVQYIGNIMNALKLDSTAAVKDSTPEVKSDDVILPHSLDSMVVSTDANTQTTPSIVCETKSIKSKHYQTESVKTVQVHIKTVTHSEPIAPVNSSETKPPVKTAPTKSVKKGSNKSTEKGSVKKTNSTISKPKTSSKKQKSSVKKPKNKWSYKIDEVGDSDTDREEEFRHLPCKIIHEYVESEKMLESPSDVSDTLQHYLTKSDVSRSVWTVKKKYSHNELMVILDIKGSEVSGMPIVSASNNRGVSVPVLPILPFGNESSALDLTIGCLYGISVPQRLSNKQRNVFQRYVRIAIARARHPELFDMVSLGAIKYVRSCENSVEVKISVKEMQYESRYEEESERRKIIRLLKRASAQAEFKNMLETGTFYGTKDTPSDKEKDTPLSTGNDTPSSKEKDTPSSTGKYISLVQEAPSNNSNSDQSSQNEKTTLVHSAVPKPSEDKSHVASTFNIEEVDNSLDRMLETLAAKKKWHEFSNDAEDIPEDETSSITSSNKKSRRKFRDKFQSCENCNSVIIDRIRICSGCRKVCYCNQHCQKVHWKTHKKTCLYALAKEQVTG